MLIDCHTHLNRYADDAPTSLSDRLALLRAEMDRQQIAHALVLASYLVNPDRPGTRELLDAIGDDPRIGVVAAFLWAGDRQAQLRDLRDLLQARRIRGVKLYPGYEPFFVHAPELSDLYRLAAEFRVPVMVHTGDTFLPGARIRFAHPLHLDEAAVSFPETTFVICHLGSPWFMDATEVIYKNANVFGDLSGLTVGAFDERLERFVLRQVNDALAYLNDPTKLLFGSDWPITDVESCVHFVHRLDATPEELQGLLWRNAARVFGIERGGLGGGAPP